MDARGLVRSVWVLGGAWRAGAVRSAWRRRRADAVGLPQAGAERARVPGRACGAQPLPGGGLIRFERASLRVRVAVGGAVFCGWDGAGPQPSYALAGDCPEADTRAGLEPDKDGGWRVLSERLLIVVSRYGGVEVRTPGGVLLRRELPPRWWEPVDGAGGPGGDGGVKSGEGGAGGRWAQRSQVAADARFFGLGGRACGARLRDGTYRLWNTAPSAAAPPEAPLPVTMPVQLVVADAGTHLLFHDNSWDGRVVLAEGVEGRGSGHDRPGRCTVRMSGGPLRYWVLSGSPSRVLQGWSRLSGAPALPPRWALGHQHARPGEDEAELRATAREFADRGLPLRALHVDTRHHVGHRVFTVDRRRFPDVAGLAAELRAEGVALVSAVGPAVTADPGDAVHTSGAAADAFVRDGRGRRVRGVARPGAALFPDFTEPRVRKWWGGLYEERLARGFAGVWHESDEPFSLVAFGERTLPRSARHALEGRGGDHREAHNVYGLAMAEAGYAGLGELRPQRRPFLFSRSGWAGMQRYGGAGAWNWWDGGRPRGGEEAAGWGRLRESLAVVLGLGLSGVPYAGPDIGDPDGPPDPELFLRWFQLGAYLPLFRTRVPGGRGARDRTPNEFGPRVAAGCAAAMAERERLLPYFVTLAELAHRTGAPYARPLWWQHPRDRALRDCEDAFLLGDALLVAPVLEPGVRRRRVRLPRGCWYDTATGTAYDGPGEVAVPAPAERIPVLARAGAVVPVAASGGGTELEVWAPARGRTGRGLVIPDEGDGWERAVPERFTVRRQGRRPVVAREDGGAVGYPVRWRT